MSLDDDLKFLSLNKFKNKLKYMVPEMDIKIEHVGSKNYDLSSFKNGFEIIPRIFEKEYSSCKKYNIVGAHSPFSLFGKNFESYSHVGLISVYSGYLLGDTL